MRLSKAQIRALKLAAKNNGITDTLLVHPSTGHSLFKKGLFFKHDSTSDRFEGTTISYQLTGKGWDVVLAMDQTVVIPQRTAEVNLPSGGKVKISIGKVTIHKS